MSQAEAVFKIIEEKNCPLYEAGDEFKLTGKAVPVEEDEKKFIITAIIRTPDDKAICRILVSDITAVLVEYESMESIAKYVTNCSGCTGLIKIDYQKGRRSSASSSAPMREDNIGFATKLLNKFPIFESLEQSDIKKLVPLLKMKKFPKGSIIMKKGESGTNLFIIVSGKAEVLVDDTVISVMEKGEVFGEISLLIGTPVGANIRVLEVVTVLFIYGRDFKKVLNMFPTLQMFFARLLAERLAKTNVERLEEFTSGMVGRLSENPPSELFQTMNLNHKIGILTLTLSRGTAELAFKDGGLVRSEYDNKKGKEAFFEILKEKDGRFKFTPGLPPQDMKSPEMGDFMWLLMEGMRRIDEGIA